MPVLSNENIKQATYINLQFIYKQVESILIRYLTQLNISKILFRCAITIKWLMRHFAFFLFHSKCEIQCEFYIYSTSQLSLASFPLLSSHRWSVAIILNSTGLCAQDDLLVGMSHKLFSDLLLVDLPSISLPTLLHCFLRNFFYLSSYIPDHSFLLATLSSLTS